MRPYTLKRDILYHAIQGNLVPQDSSEGTGQSLIIENIRKRKNYSLDIQKRIGKGCKPIQESELIFDIPDSWAWERFGNLVINYDSQRRPITKSDRKTTKGLYDYYGATGAIDRVDEYIFDGEFLMIGEDGGNFFVDRDNSFIVRGTFWANNHVHVVQPIVCNIEYLKICLDAYDLPNLGLINGIAVPKLNQDNLNSILVPVPPLAEQKRIVAKIEELLPLIDRYEKAWSRLEDFNKRFPGDMQKSLLQMAIQGKLVDQRPEEGTGEELYRQIQAEKQALIKTGKIKKEKPLPEIAEGEIPFEIPVSWKWVRFGELFALSNGTASRGTPGGQKYPVLRLADISSTQISVDNIREIALSEKEFNSHRLKTNDLVFIRVNGSRERVATAYHYSATNTISYCDHLFCGHRLSESVFSEFVMIMFNCEATRLQLRPEIKTTAGQNTISQTSMVKILLPLPPLAEQKRIVARLEELLPLCERLK